MSSKDQDWSLLLTGDGTPTLAHPEHGQACHSSAGAWLEAWGRYGEACSIAQRARKGVVRLLDIGTGCGWNLAEALLAVETNGGTLEAYSFELDRRVLAKTIHSFEKAEPHPAHEPVRHSLQRALERESEPVSLGVQSNLRLFLGDARETLLRLPQKPLFDVVFLDPFSKQVTPELWEPDFLKAIAIRMDAGSILSTYSTSLQVSAALTQAGLHVGRGPLVGGKSGSLASPDLPVPPLPDKTHRKILRRASRISASSRSKGAQ